MKARLKYRIYQTVGQKYQIALLIGCTRVVWNDSLAFCQEKYRLGEKKPYLSELQKQFITQAKKTEDREWLSEVFAIPLQQSLNDLNQADKNFFRSTKGKSKGKPIKLPKFKSRKSRQTARFTKGGFKLGQHKVDLAKVGKLKIIWSRKLPAVPSSVTVIKECREDSRLRSIPQEIAPTRYFLNLVIETCAKILPKTDNLVGIDLGIKTFATVGRLHATSLHGEKIDAPKPLKKRIKK